jgi:hypothetical protein
MPTSPLVVRTILLVSIFLVAAPAAFAAPSTTTTHEIVTGTVTWTLTPEQCSSIHAPISGTGERHQVIITKVNADGSSQIIINDQVKGTASDSTGTYRFVYLNHSVEDVPVQAGNAHHVRMTDTFMLTGTGRANHLYAGFNWRWTYTPPAASWPPVDHWQQLSTRGDPLHCDPI